MRQAAARLETLRNAFTREAAADDESAWQSFAAALEDDFDTPAALAVLHEWASSGQLELLRARPRRVRARVGRRARSRRLRRSSRSPNGGSRRAPRATSRPPTGSGTSSLAAGWEMRDRADGYDLVRI